MSEWWDHGSQVNAAANACAANQGAQGDQFFGVRRDVPLGGEAEKSDCRWPPTNAQKRIAELEAENAKLREILSDSAESKIDLGMGVIAANARASEASARANALADECGRLRDENTQLLAENARLRRGKR